LAVSHFNFINLFPPRQREKLFRSVASLVRPGGFWITDFSEPRHAPQDVIDTLKLSSGKTLFRKGHYNIMQDFFQQDWQTPSHCIQERFWFGHYSSAAVLAKSTGWTLELRKSWHPYAHGAAWQDPGEHDEIWIDVYQNKEN
ncbi:MAG: hypothetical protein ABL857_03885, partial [Rickettsiales bacterium]